MRGEVGAQLCLLLVGRALGGRVSWTMAMMSSGKRAAVVGAGHGEEFEMRGDEVAAVAEVELHRQNGVLAASSGSSNVTVMCAGPSWSARATSRFRCGCRGRFPGGSLAARSWP